MLGVKNSINDDYIKKLNLLYISMQEDIQKILEIISRKNANQDPLISLGERLEKIEYDFNILKIATNSIDNDLQLIKIRTEKILENLTIN